MTERIPQILLALVLGSALILLVAGLQPEPEGGVARAHPEFAKLLVAPDGSTGGALGLTLGWALGALQIGFFVGCFALGVNRRPPRRRWGLAIGIGFGLYQLVWLVTVLAYSRFAADPSGSLIGSLPPPTAWMLYVLWPTPLYFAVLFWLRFEDAFLSERDLQQFRDRLAELQAHDRH